MIVNVFKTGSIYLAAYKGTFDSLVWAFKSYAERSACPIKINYKILNLLPAHSIHPYDVSISASQQS